MRLIAGLGNPGRQYEQTRHNVGWTVLDRLARRHAPGAVARCKFHGIVVDAAFGPDRAILLKPTTFMNRCGQAVAEAVRFYKLDPGADLLVIVDDTALPCGMVRLRAEGGAGGQTGDVRWAPADELRLLIIHGGLHVCGWDHAEPGEGAAMRALERRLLDPHPA